MLRWEYILAGLLLAISAVYVVAMLLTVQEDAGAKFSVVNGTSILIHLPVVSAAGEGERVDRPDNIVELPEDLARKFLEDGSSISTSDAGAELYGNMSVHYYVIGIPTRNLNFPVANTQLTRSMRAGNVIQHNFYPIIDTQPFTRNAGAEDLFNETGPTGEQVERTINWTRYILGARASAISTTTSRNWMLEVITHPMAAGVFNVSLGSLLFDPTLSACGTALSANTVYTLNQTINNSGATCLTISATNVTINCAGYSILGGNNTATYGIRITSTGNSSTIGNCTISGYENAIFYDDGGAGYLHNSTLSSYVSGGEALYFDRLGSGNSLIENLTVYSNADDALQVDDGMRNTFRRIIASTNAVSAGRGIYINLAHFSVIDNSTSMASSGSDDTPYYCQNTNGFIIANSTGYLRSTSSTDGVFETTGTCQNATLKNMTLKTIVNGGDVAMLNINGNNITFDNITGYGVSRGIYGSSSFNITVKNSVVIVNGTASAITFDNADDLVVWNNTLYAEGATTLNLNSGTERAIIRDNTIFGGNRTSAATAVVTLAFNDKHDRIWNNTIISPGQNTTLLSVQSNASNITVYWNNFTRTTSNMVTDANGTNFYNSTISGQNEGNIWFNTGSNNLSGSTDSGIPNYKIATSGTAYPVNITTNPKFSCNFVGCGDFAPLFIPSASTCTYSSGNWAITCSDNCTFTSNVDVGGNNITISGGGLLSLNGANITNFGTRKVTGASATNQCIIRRTNGGGFRGG